MADAAAEQEEEYYEEPHREWTPEEQVVFRKYDLTMTLAKHLDKHLLYPLLMHTLAQGVYPPEEAQAAELELLSKTHMVDHYIQKYQEFNGQDGEPLPEDQVPRHIMQQKDAVLKMWQKRNLDAKQFLDFFGRETPEEEETSISRYEALEASAAEATEGAEEKEGQPAPKQSNFNRAYLEEHFAITDKHINALYLWAKLQYECGMYEKTASYLFYYRRLGPLNFDYWATWGKMSAEILSQQWPLAVESASLVVKAIADQEELLHSAKPQESVYADIAAVANARAWYMHWALFIFFNEDDGQGTLLDDGLDRLVEGWKGSAGWMPGWLPDSRTWTSSVENDKKQTVWLRIIQCLCPHLLRYVCAAVIIGMEENGKRRDRDGVPNESGHIKMRTHLRNLVRLVENEKRYYRDPIVEFVEKLCSECDFDAAHLKLQQCEVVLESDFFLHQHKDRFLIQGRKMIFENHCKIHSVMDITMVAAKLNTDRDTAERYIVKMIRNAALDAKIDSEANQVILASQGNNIYKQVREKTKVVRDRTDQLIERLQDKRPEEGEEQEQQEQQQGKPTRAPRPQMKRSQPTQARRRNDYSMFFGGR